MTTFNNRISVKPQKYKRGRQLKVKIHILFYGDNSRTVALKKMKLGTVKYHGHAYKFRFNYFVSRSI
jgi:hypothetical protein